MDRLLVGLRIAVVLLLLMAVAGPVLTLVGTRNIPARLAVVVEDSGSMALVDAGLPDSDGLLTSRWEQALSWSRDLVDGSPDIADEYDVVLLRGGGVEPAREFRLDDAVIPAPSGHGTKLDALLQQTRDRLADRAPRAIVLFSDGQETGRAAVARSRTSLGRSALFVVETGDSRGPADRMLMELRYPDAAYAGDEVVVEFAVDHRFAADRDTGAVRVTLHGSDGLVAESFLSGDTPYLQGELTFVPSGTGLQVFELAVDPLDDERFLANNRVSLAVDVRRERARILVVAPVPGWDVRLLAQAALREERLELAVARPGPDGLVLADSSGTLMNWPQGIVGNPWVGWDGFILAGWPSGVPGVDWGGLVRAVEAGAGLLVLPGPGEDRGSSRADRLPEAVRSMLPVTAASWDFQPGSWFLLPASEQAGHPVLEGLIGERNPGGNPRGSGGPGSLPPVTRLVAVQPRVEAEVLARAGSRQSDPTTGAPLLVSGTHGTGRVVWFGGRRLWELAFWELAGTDPTADGTEQAGRRLLRNLLVWVGAGGEDAGLVFTGRQPFFQEGERIRLSARWRDLRGRPVQGRDVALELRSADADSNRVRTFGLAPVPGDPGLLQVTVPPLPPGSYLIRLRGEGDPPVLSPEGNLVVASHSVETTPVRTDRRRLTGLASGSGGTFIAASDPEGFDALLAGLAALDWSPDQDVDRRRLDFWSTWPFLALVALLLGTEWFVRRRQGQL
jgi:hypothetical protein